MHGWVRTRMNASLRFSLNCGAHFTWNRRHLGVEVVDVNSRVGAEARIREKPLESFCPVRCEGFSALGSLDMDSKAVIHFSLNSWEAPAKIQIENSKIASKTASSPSKAPEDSPK